MNFYIFEETDLDLLSTDPEQKSPEKSKTIEKNEQGLPVMLAVKIFDSLGKDPKYKSIDKLQDIILLDHKELKFSEGNMFPKIGEIKEGRKSTIEHVSANSLNIGEIIKLKNNRSIFTTEYALVNSLNVGEIINLKNNKSIFTTLFGGTMYFSHNKSNIENILEKQLNQTFKTEGHKQAYMWLETGETGTSSLTLCKSLYNLKHRKLEDLESSFPYDLDDFRRCAKFINSVDGAKELLKTKKLTSEWTKIVNNWDEIEKGAFSTDKAVAKNSYDLLKDCIKPVPKKTKLGT